MNTEFANYKDRTIRFTQVSDNGILLNSEDVCAALEAENCLPAKKLNQPCVNLAVVIEVALTQGRDDVEFVDWLEANFRGYEVRTEVFPGCC